MPFTVNDFQDLVRLLEEHPEWQSGLRRLVLTEDLLTLPQAMRDLAHHVQALTEAQERAEERLQRLEERVGGLEERVGRLEEAVTALAEAQRHAEERLQRLEEAVIALAEAQRRTEERLEEVRMDLREQIYQQGKRMHDTLSAFGARWGLRSEAAWRRGVAATLQGLGFHLEQFRAMDQ